MRLIARSEANPTLGSTVFGAGFCEMRFALGVAFLASARSACPLPARCLAGRTPFFFDAFRSRSALFRCMCRLIGNMVYCATWWRGCSASTLAGGGALVCMRGFQCTVCAGRYLLPSVVSPCFLAMVLILRWSRRCFPFPSLIRRRPLAGIVSFGKPWHKFSLSRAVHVLHDE